MSTTNKSHRFKIKSRCCNVECVVFYDNFENTFQILCSKCKKAIDLKVACNKCHRITGVLIEY